MSRAAALPSAPKRTKIDRAGLVSIYTRLFGTVPEKITKEELERRIKTFGSCECDRKACREPFKGYCEFDHEVANASSDGSVRIIWKALTKDCHLLKTHGPMGDNAKTRKLKRKLKGMTQADTRAAPSIQGNSNIQSAGFQPRPEGAPSQWQKRDPNFTPRAAKVID